MPLCANATLLSGMWVLPQFSLQKNSYSNNSGVDPSSLCKFITSMLLTLTTDLKAFQGRDKYYEYWVFTDKIRVLMGEL